MLMVRFMVSGQPGIVVRAFRPWLDIDRDFCQMVNVVVRLVAELLRIAELYTARLCRVGGNDFAM